MPYVNRNVEYRDDGTWKRCTRCKEVRPASEFGRSSAATATGLTPQCLQCRRELVRDWRERNPRKRQAYRQLVKTKERAQAHGLTEAQYRQLLDSQGGVCAICGQPERRTRKSTGVRLSLAVDHCHKTGRIRGLLCGDCNYALGILDDDIERLESAVEYLRAHQ